MYRTKRLHRRSIPLRSRRPSGSNPMVTEPIAKYGCAAPDIRRTESRSPRRQSTAMQPRCSARQPRRHDAQHPSEMRPQIMRIALNERSRCPHVLERAPVTIRADLGRLPTHSEAVTMQRPRSGLTSHSAQALCDGAGRGGPCYRVPATRRCATANADLRDPSFGEHRVRGSGHCGAVTNTASNSMMTRRPAMYRWLTSSGSYTI